MPANLITCSHPLLSHHLAILRNQQTQAEVFRQSLQRVSWLVLTEATKQLPVVAQQIETPCGICQTTMLDASCTYIIAPILRAGLSMVNVMLELLPTASVYHLGLYRDEATFEPVIYYNKLRKNIAEHSARVFILDPMLATGGSATAAVELFKKIGVKESQITVACVIASTVGIAAVHNHFPDVTIYAGAVDETLDQRAYIIPGLGDAGDRMFHTQ